MAGQGFIGGLPWFKAGKPVFGSGEGCGDEPPPPRDCGCACKINGDYPVPLVWQATLTSTKLWKTQRPAEFVYNIPGGVYLLPYFSSQGAECVFWGDPEFSCTEPSGTVRQIVPLLTMWGSSPFGCLTTLSWGFTTGGSVPVRTSSGQGLNAQWVVDPGPQVNTSAYPINYDCAVPLTHQYDGFPGSSNWGSSLNRCDAGYATTAAEAVTFENGAGLVSVQPAP